MSLDVLKIPGIENIKKGRRERSSDQEFDDGERWVKNAYDDKENLVVPSAGTSKVSRC